MLIADCASSICGLLEFSSAIILTLRLCMFVTPPYPEHRIGPVPTFSWVGQEKASDDHIVGNIVFLLVLLQNKVYSYKLYV